jgi:hypothetical protein
MSGRRRTEAGHPVAGRRGGDEREGIVDPCLVPPAAGAAGLLGLQQQAGNRAVAGAIAVQRYAFVRDKQVLPSHPSLSPALKAMAGDTTVRDYESGGEFAAHAEGKTDHVGTLRSPASPGTWLRFPRTGSNLLGEDHTRVTLEHVVAAVGSTNFVYEPLAVDDLSASPGMKAAYETENADRLKRMGIGGVADTRKFGSESLFPKIGFAMTVLLPLLRSRSFDTLKKAQYVGQPAQRYLKIGWGYGKDVPAEIAARKAAGSPVPPELRKLAATCRRVAATLDPFVTGLPVDGFLGDALDTPSAGKVVPDLIAFGQDLEAAMAARLAADTTLSDAERKRLATMPKRTEDQRGAMFAAARDMQFSHAVRDAVARGVRYAGMGQLHLAAMQAEGLPKGATGFDMTDKGIDISLFEAKTTSLAKRATSP